eukprot:gene17635-21006_t
MSISHGTFICVCPPKALTFDDPESLVVHRKTEVDLSGFLKEFEFNGEIVLGEGGGIAVTNVEDTYNVKTWKQDRLISAFCGVMENKEMLVGKMVKDPDYTLREGVEIADINEAEVIIYLFSKYGRKCVTRVRGEFALAIFDARLVRVYAARDPSGVVPLNQVRLRDGTVAIMNFDVGGFECYCECVTEIPPGHYIHGGRRSDIAQQ